MKKNSRVRAGALPRPPIFFNHWWACLSFAIMFVPLVVGVIVLIKRDSPLGLILMFLGVILSKFCIKHHGTSPITFGLVTYAGKLSDTVVAGTVPILPFPPFCVDTIPVEMAWERIDFPVNDVLSKDGAYLNGKVTMNLRPNADHLRWFVEAGGMDGMIRRIHSGLCPRLRTYARRKPWQDLQWSHSEPGGLLIDQIANAYPEVDVRTLTLHLSAPAELVEKAKRKMREDFVPTEEDFAFARIVREAQKRRAAAIRAQGTDKDVPPTHVFIKEIQKEQEAARN